MDRRDRFDKLPGAYRKGLQMRADGVNDLEIADTLGMEPEGVANLLAIAEAKLRTLSGEPSRQSRRPGSEPPVEVDEGGHG
jgi:hypothetical protein